jgi:hypothetical protein
LGMSLLNCLCGFGGHFKVEKAVFWHRFYLYAVYLSVICPTTAPGF